MSALLSWIAGGVASAVVTAHLVMPPPTRPTPPDATLDDVRIREQVIEPLRERGLERRMFSRAVSRWDEDRFQYRPVAPTPATAPVLAFVVEQQGRFLPEGQEMRVVWRGRLDRRTGVVSLAPPGGDVAKAVWRPASEVLPRPPLREGEVRLPLPGPAPVTLNPPVPPHREVLHAESAPALRPSSR
ncbi:MAG: hypothetical protein H6826_07185 [Planctomycetes bacterium]|nr:hypothetical protein [Planctomycetota bacterium]MCB9826326.1 hypothetical protein [Planctomycetota bacterium]MCB9901122.1 hypothetical protein [Planctomycetota bacterium]